MLGLQREWARGRLETVPLAPEGRKDVGGDRAARMLQVVALGEAEASGVWLSPRLPSCLCSRWPPSSRAPSAFRGGARLAFERLQWLSAQHKS